MFDFLSIPVDSTVGYLGVVSLFFGFFLILAGLSVVKVQQISVTPGMKTWLFGLFFVALGFVALRVDAAKPGDGGAANASPTTVAESTPASTPVPPTSAPAVDPTVTPVPPTAAPTPTVEVMSPEQAIRDYYQAIDDGQYETSWAMLSTQFKSAFNCCTPNGSPNFTDYVAWWDSVERVDIGELIVTEQDDASALVYVQLSYLMKTGERIPDVRPYVELALDEPTGTWLFADKRATP